MPARLFVDDPEGTRADALAATLRSIDSVLAEPIEDCLARDEPARRASRYAARSTSRPTWALPGGHIFHRDLALAVGGGRRRGRHGGASARRTPAC